MTRAAETWRQRVAVSAYALAAVLGRTLPERVAYPLYRRVGLLAHDLMPATRRTVAANQARVLGRGPSDPIVRAATREAFASYARYWYDTFHVGSVSDEAMLERFHAVDADNLWGALEDGKGVICALPHLGNWDAAGRWVVANGRPLVSVAEQLEPPRLFELFMEHRRALGFTILGTADAGVGRQLASHLSQNTIVALVADRDLAGRGVEVTMFGEPRRIPAGPALLSITTGAPLIVSPVYQTSKGWICVFGAPLQVEPSGDRRADVIALTTLMAKAFERAIAAAPSEWHLFQAGWPP